MTAFTRRTTVWLTAGATALVLAAAGLAAGGYGPGMGMMGGGSIGGGAGPAGAEAPTAAQLTALRDRVDGWLARSGYKGFAVGEVMAFTNNDYVAVHDAAGAPAFELLTNLSASWLMEEPPSMMWNTRYGVAGDVGGRVTPIMGGWMMGGRGWSSWYRTGAGRVASVERAVAVANQWLAKTSGREQVASDAGGAAMGKFPGYYTFDTTRDGVTYGMLSVNAATGAVWYHGWHGAFLSELDF